jgi:dihydrolipoamide dehydrogenase
LIENGIRIIKGVRVKNIRKEGDRLFIDYLSKMDEGGSMDAEIILTMRRIPAVIGLGLERAGVKWDENGIPVDNELRTNVSNIYAIGDVTGGEMYSHRASAQGILAAENIHGMKKRFDPIYTPRAFYGIPEIGSVGLTEREAKARGLSFKVGLIPYSLNSMAMIYLKTEGIIKVICETKYGEVIGVHIIGPNASELICQAAIAMQMEATAEDIARVIFPHPSLSESFAEAARDALGKSLYIPSS